MAIEFNCPYCTAPIRVPDTFSGKKGSCPKCATKLLVPNVAPPQPEQPQRAPASLAPESSTPQVASPEPVTTPAPDGPIPQPVAPKQAAGGQQVPPFRPTVLPPVSASAAGVPQQLPPPVVDPQQKEVPVAAPQAVDAGTLNFGEPQAAAEAPQFAAPLSTTNLSRRLKKKQRRGQSQRMFTLGIPLVLFAIFLVVIGILTIVDDPDLTGEMVGGRFRVEEIPIATVAASECGLRGKDVRTVVDGFSSSPETLTGPWNRCVISGEKNSLTVTVRTVSGASWFTVNPQEDPVLSKWIRDKRPEINKQRLKLIADTGTELCAMKLKRINGESAKMSATRFRDDFALACHLQAFGFAVEAVVGSRVTMCAHEDIKGTLYFALPEGTKEFTLRGRAIEHGGPRLFPGEYTVVVAGLGDEDATDESSSDAESVSNDEDGNDPPAMDESAPDVSEPGMNGSDAIMNGS